MTQQQVPNILFVGGFGTPRDGTEGGQMFACRSLVASALKEHVRWKLVDTTQRSEPPPHVIIRSWHALIRLIRLIGYLSFSRVDTVLIFTAFWPLSIMEKGLMCVIGRLYGKRVVLSIRYQPFLSRRFRLLYRQLARFAFNRCDAIWCQSQFSADELVRIFAVDPKRTVVIPNWIDVERFSGPAAVDRAKTPGEPTRLLYLGWLHPQKGLEFLLPAIQILGQKRTDFRLDICGGGGLEDDLKQLARKLNIEELVQFRGWIPQDQVQNWFRNSDLFVFPTLGEGMPNSLLQAMACGLPVVTTNVSGIPEIVRDEVHGSVVPPRSPEALATAIERWLDDEAGRRRAGLANRDQIAQRHDLRRVWTRVAEVLCVPLLLNKGDDKRARAEARLPEPGLSVMEKPRR